MMSTEGTHGSETVRDPLQQAWLEAYDRMFNVAGPTELIAAIDISMRRDPEQIALWLEAQEPNITPETAFFLKTSEAIKRTKHNPGSKLGQ